MTRALVETEGFEGTAVPQYANLRQGGDPPSEAKKPRSTAEALGQVFTDSAVADLMVRHLGLFEAPLDAKVIDPCVGPATFPLAIHRATRNRLRIDACDIDPRMCERTRAEAAEMNADISVEQCDYLQRKLSGNYDYAIMNPPYVRQEWIRLKSLYRHNFLQANIKIPGTSNLYVYFVAKAVLDIKQGGKFAAILYDSWQSTLYGRWLKKFLDAHCVKWSCEPVPNCPFEGRLIDATIVYGERGYAPEDEGIVHSGIDLGTGFIHACDAFSVRRGLRLKQADFFLTGMDRAAEEGATPFVKKINKISGYAVLEDHEEAAILLRPFESNPRARAALDKRLNHAKNSPQDNIAILTWHQSRHDKWCYHAAPPKDPILFNYYIRNRPKHIFNQQLRAYGDNFYGVTPKSDIAPVAWLAALNATASVIGILQKARNQGAGLAKLQLFEYREAAVVDVGAWSERNRTALEKLGQALTVATTGHKVIIEQIDDLVWKAIDRLDLHPSTLALRLTDADSAAKLPKGIIR